MDLAVPLLPTQIEAAMRIQHHLSQWIASDRALYLLHDRLPGFAIEATLVKVAAVNQLYGTNVYAVVRMAQHVTQIMAEESRAVDEAALVERLAALPPTPGQRSARKHISFASKFAHFFIDAERFPIYDYYAERMVVYHLGRRAIIVDTQHPYRAFIQNIIQLRERAQLVCTMDELDSYLWLAGLYQAWRKNPNAQINAEVTRLFAAPPAELLDAFDLLLPADQGVKGTA